MTQQTQNQTTPEKDFFANTTWATQNVAGSYSSMTDVTLKLKEAAARGCRIIGGMSVMPLPLGHEVCVTVVPIEEASLYPINKSAKAFVEGGQDAINKLDKKDQEMPRWGLGKSIIMSIATAAGVEWTYRKRIDDQSDPYFCEVEVKGRYKQVDGTFRDIGQTCDMDFRAGSAQIAGKTEAGIAQLRATIRRKAETGAKLRALREAFGIEHGIPDNQIDRPFVFVRVVMTGRTDDPELRKLFGMMFVQQHLAASGALFGQMTPMLPTIGDAPIGQLAPAQKSDNGLDDDEADTAAGTRAASPAVPPKPAPFPAEPPKPAPAPANPAKTYLPGKGKGTVAEALDKDLTYWEGKLRQKFDEGMDPQYAHKDTVVLLTIRARMRQKNLPFPPHDELDALDPAARTPEKSAQQPAARSQQAAAPTNGTTAQPSAEPVPVRRPNAYGGQKPPSDRGAPADPRPAAQARDENPFSSDGDADSDEYGDDRTF